MLSKLLQPCRVHAVRLLVLKTPRQRSVRAMWGVPPSQYDMPIPNKLRLGYALRVYWEIIPLFITTVISFSILAGAIIWACKNKVDIVFTTHNRSNISRTMDLRNPTVHKMLIIHQRYEPWPEMQDVLDKMITAEKRALVRMQSCAHS